MRERERAKAKLGRPMAMAVDSLKTWTQFSILIHLIVGSIIWILMWENRHILPSQMRRWMHRATWMRNRNEILTNNNNESAHATHVWWHEWVNWKMNGEKKIKTWQINDLWLGIFTTVATVELPRWWLLFTHVRLTSVCVSSYVLRYRLEKLVFFPVSVSIYSSYDVKFASKSGLRQYVCFNYGINH